MEAKSLRDVIREGRAALAKVETHMQVGRASIKVPFPHVHVPVNVLARLLDVVEAAEAHVVSTAKLYAIVGGKTYHSDINNLIDVVDAAVRYVDARWGDEPCTDERFTAVENDLLYAVRVEP